MVGFSFMGQQETKQTSESAYEAVGEEGASANDVVGGASVNDVGGGASVNDVSALPPRQPNFVAVLRELNKEAWNKYLQELDVFVSQKASDEEFIKKCVETLKREASYAATDRQRHFSIWIREEPFSNKKFKTEDIQSLKVTLANAILQAFCKETGFVTCDCTYSCESIGRVHMKVYSESLYVSGRF